MRRLLAAGSALGLLAHNAFETRAGVGLVFEPFIGRRGAVALWSAYFPLMLAAAAREGENARRLSAFSAGIGVAGVAVHFKAWPWSLHGGLPMLDEAEGLSEDQLPAYNAVLWFWLLSSALSLPAANRPGARRFAVAGLLNFPILLASAQHHFRWAREQAELRTGALEPGAARMSGAALWPGGARRRAQPQLRQPRRGGGTGAGGAAGRRTAGSPRDRARGAAARCSGSSTDGSSPRPSSSRG